MIRVLVVDDSYLMRKVIKDILESDSKIKVVGLAKDGLDAIKKTKELKPDVIILDIEMPVMSGIDALDEIMRTQPTPAIMLSTHCGGDSPEAINSFGYGAIDVICKPTMAPSEVTYGGFGKELLRLVKIALLADVKRFNKEHARVRGGKNIASKKILLIGASSGGPLAVQKVLYSLPKDFPCPILVVQHMPAQFTKEFAKRLNKLCKVRVKEGEEGDLLEPGLAIVAPGNKHMEIKKLGGAVKVRLNNKAQVNNSRPSVDVTMLSALEIYASKTIGVILSGMGHDGATAMEEIKELGGETIAQDEDTSLIYGMPKAVVERNAANYVLPLEKIGKKIMDLL